MNSTHTKAERKTYDLLLTEPTLAELKNSQLCDSYVHAVWVDLASSKGRAYSAVHVPVVSGPHVLLATQDHMDEEDLRGVAGTVALETGGMMGEITRRTGDLCCRVELPYQPSQRNLAGFIDDYRRVFSNVRVDRVVFSNVPEEALVRSGFPESRLEKVLKK